MNKVALTNTLIGKIFLVINLDKYYTLKPNKKFI